MKVGRIQDPKPPVERRTRVIASRAMTFSGFQKETVGFLQGIRDHNRKAWFDAHREDYERAFLAPAQAFSEALAPRLRKIDPEVVVEPRVNGSIMRINRDIRFSKDKTPYKDHLDLWFWTGERKGWDSSGFFFRLTPDESILGAGIHRFAPPTVARYRTAVLDSRRGGALARLVESLRADGYEVGTESYKKVPAGATPDHSRATLLRHGGLHATWQGEAPRGASRAGVRRFRGRALSSNGSHSSLAQDHVSASRLTDALHGA
jgi:uncharacterized protein (TIGR02453 family)